MKLPVTCALASQNEGAEKSVDLKLQLLLRSVLNGSMFLLSHCCKSLQCLLHNRLNVPYCQPGREGKKKNLCGYRDLKILCPFYLLRSKAECELER
jgi:hypothetical protein